MVTLGTSLNLSELGSSYSVNGNSNSSCLLGLLGALLELIWAKVHCEQNVVIEPELHCVPFCHNNDPGHWKESGRHQWMIGCGEGAETLRSSFKGGEGERRARQPPGGSEARPPFPSLRGHVGTMVADQEYQPLCGRCQPPLLSLACCCPGTGRSAGSRFCDPRGLPLPLQVLRE